MKNKLTPELESRLLAHLNEAVAIMIEAFEDHPPIQCVECGLYNLNYTVFCHGCQTQIVSAPKGNDEKNAQQMIDFRQSLGLTN